MERPHHCTDDSQPARIVLLGGYHRVDLASGPSVNTATGRTCKTEPTFAEALVDVHRYLEALQNTPTTPATMGSLYYSTVLLDIIIKVACYSV